MNLSHAEIYFDSQAAIYNATRRHFLRGRESATALLGVEPGDRVADFACGTGLNFDWFYRAGASEVIGIDASSRMLDRAKRRYPDAHVLQGDIVTCSIEGEVQKVFCSYALSLIDDWEKAIENMVRSLSRDGRLAILDFGPMRGALRFSDPLFRWWIGIHGADPDRGYRAVLERFFRSVEVHLPKHGFAVTLIGDGLL